MYNRSLRYIAASAALVLGVSAAAGCSSGSGSSSGRLYNAAVEMTNESGEAVTRLDYTVIINGEEITFPASLEQLKTSGWAPENPEEASGFYSKGGVRILLRSCQKSDDDYKVNGVSVRQRNNKDVQFTVSTSKGVELNVSTKEDVVNIYGDPDKEWEYGEYFYYEFGPEQASDRDLDRNAVGFEFDDNGIVNSIFVMR
ncbi:MAG: hypothetical protein IJK31_00160 [Ruminococcus sp.]|nr:hypothetical protein [Ruminococcus sp.]HRR76861.1 hypothetical protein [Ruminococcus sp.]